MATKPKTYRTTFDLELEENSVPDIGHVEDLLRGYAGIIERTKHTRYTIVIEAKDEYELAEKVRDIEDDLRGSDAPVEIPRPKPWDVPKGVRLL